MHGLFFGASSKGEGGDGGNPSIRLWIVGKAHPSSMALQQLILFKTSRASHTTGAPQYWALCLVRLNTPRGGRGVDYGIEGSQNPARLSASLTGVQLCGGKAEMWSAATHPLLQPGQIGG
jgi:hypothetical protein